MDIARFVDLFERRFANNKMFHLARFPPFNRVARKLLDPCPNVAGMASYKKLMLLRLLVSLLPTDSSECYAEVGTYQGKSLVAALKGNPGRVAVACDDFSQFDPSGANMGILQRNLEAFRLDGQVKFFNMDFRQLFASWNDKQLPRIGVYLYDGAHDERSQYDAIRLAEELLAEQALVVIDDWRHSVDSSSYAEAGTRRAMADSAQRWTVLQVLPARFNGDLDQWWNGIAVLGFERRL